MENGVWYILAALIMGWTGFCIYKWIKNRKRGGCGCGCTGCPHSEFFHKFMRFVLGIICYN